MFGLFVSSGVPARHLCFVSVTRYSRKHTLKIVKIFFLFVCFWACDLQLMNPLSETRFLLKAEKKKACGCGFKITFPDSPTPDTLWATCTESPGLWWTSEKSKACRSPILGWRQQWGWSSSPAEFRPRFPEDWDGRTAYCQYHGASGNHELLCSQELGKGNFSTEFYEGGTGRAVSFLHHCERKRARKEDLRILADPAPVAWLAWNLAEFLLRKWGRDYWEWQAHLSAGPSLSAAGRDCHGRSDSALSECLPPAGPRRGPQ